MVEIGLAGAMGAGKTTVADLLVASHGYTRLSFADPIRYLTTALLGRPVNKQFDRSTLQRVGRSARSEEWAGIDTPLEEARQARTQALAEFIFPEAKDEQVKALYRVLYEEGYSYGWGHAGYWMERWKKHYVQGGHPAAVDDVRFPVEGEFLSRQGFFLVKLDVPLEERKRRIIARDGSWDEAWSSDPTEAFVDQIPTHLTVDGTLSPEELAEKVYQEALSWWARTRRHPVK